MMYCLDVLMYVSDVMKIDIICGLDLTQIDAICRFKIVQNWRFQVHTTGDRKIKLKIRSARFSIISRTARVAILGVGNQVVRQISPAEFSSTCTDTVTYITHITTPFISRPKT